MFADNYGMKSKTQKIQELRLLKDKLPKSKITVFTSFSPSTRSGQVRTGEKGLSVAQMTALKRLLRSIKSEYLVTKKTLIDLAFKGKKYDGLDVFSMDGSLGLVMGSEDPYEIAKKIYEFSKKNQSLHFWGAVMDDKFFGPEQFMEIAKMPSKEVLISRLVSMLTYPVRGLAVVLAGVAKKREATS